MNQPEKLQKAHVIDAKVVAKECLKFRCHILLYKYKATFFENLKFNLGAYGMCSGREGHRKI